MLSQWRAEVTFFTSVWVILHVAFGALLRVASSLQWLSAIIKRMLDIRGKPLERRGDAEQRAKRVASSLQWLSAIIKRMLDIRGQPMLCLAAMGDPIAGSARGNRSEEHTSELQSLRHLV